MGRLKNGEWYGCNYCQYGNVERGEGANEREREREREGGRERQRRVKELC